MRPERSTITGGAAFAAIFTLSLLAVPLIADAQPAGKVRRVGFLALTPQPDHDALPEGLRELGYVEGRNLAVERRSAEGHSDRLAELAADLVRLKVDVIVAQSDLAVTAVAQATATIPIVFVTLGDPKELGVVSSFARAGGDVTGFSMAAPEMAGKQLELLKEIGAHAVARGRPQESRQPKFPARLPGK